MSHDRGRKPYYGRDRPGPDRDRERDRERDWDRDRARAGYRDMRDVRSGGLPPYHSRKRSRSVTRLDVDKRRSRSPRKHDKDMIDDNILSEIAKLPEPSELWDGNQFQEGGGYSGAPMPPGGFPREPPGNYAPNYQPPQYPGIYDDFPPLASSHQPPAPVMEMWNNMALPPPPAPYHNPEDQLKKEAAIETEMRHQKAALSKQREDYIKKCTILKKELDTLKDQRNELRGDAKRSPSPDTKRFLKENTKLQLEIQNKLKTINNVVDMLNGIIGEEAQEMPEVEDSPDRKRKSRSPTNKKFNYVYYDPEMHWCRVCNEFPPTAKDYLNHLHSAAHHKSYTKLNGRRQNKSISKKSLRNIYKMAAQHMEAPWHSVTGMNEGFPSFPTAPTKRTPIRGLQFFVPSTAWYCKLCDQFIGDLHCASAHLKSIVHSKNYTNFVEQNPHWETDWMSDRQKAFEKVRANNKNKPALVQEKPQQYAAHTITFSKDGFHTKHPKTSPSPIQEVKKKKEKKKKNKKKRDSSSSSSQSDSSDSQPTKKKAKDKKKESDAKTEKRLEQWMSNIKNERLSEDDRKLWDNIKTRIKKERESPRRSPSRDKARIADMQRKIRERESERRGSQTREIREPREPRESREPREPRESREPREPRESRETRESPRPRDRYERRDKREEPTSNKPDVRKMPFIGKMPVYKHLGKAKNDEQKKEEQKKKDEEDSAKKRLELDAEIQRKVAEFKNKIARTQEERKRVDLPPPTLALPPPLVAPPPQPPQPQPLLVQPAPTPALPKDFQEALDIIFPTDPKTTEKLSQEIFNAMQQQPSLLGMPPMSGLMPPFTSLPLMQPPGMFPFDINSQIFPQPQLYDSHVPIMPKNRPVKRRNINTPVINKNKVEPKVDAAKNGDAEAKKREELDDLAMLGIDASDVGAGI